MTKKHYMQKPKHPPLSDFEAVMPELSLVMGNERTKARLQGFLRGIDQQIEVTQKRIIPYVTSMERLRSAIGQVFMSARFYEADKLPMLLHDSQDTIAGLWATLWTLSEDNPAIRDYLQTAWAELIEEILKGIHRATIDRDGGEYLKGLLSLPVQTEAERLELFYQEISAIEASSTNGTKRFRGVDNLTRYIGRWMEDNRQAGKPTLDSILDLKAMLEMIPPGVITKTQQRALIEIEIRLDNEDRLKRWALDLYYKFRDR